MYSWRAVDRNNQPVSVLDMQNQKIEKISDLSSDNRYNGHSQVQLPSNTYKLVLNSGPENLTHYQSKGQEVIVDLTNDNIDLTYTPELYETSDKSNVYKVDDVVANLKFNDVHGRGFSLKRNMATEKLTILMFMRTTCYHSRNTLNAINQLLLGANNQGMAWNEKVNVFCITSKDSRDQILQFEKGYASSIRFVSVENEELLKQFLPYSGYPSLAMIDYQGALCYADSGEHSKNRLEQLITQFSKPGLLAKDTNLIKQASLEPIGLMDEINLNLPEEIIEFNDIEPTENLPADKKLPTDLDSLRKIKPEEIAKAEVYDSRDYGIVTPVKQQHSGTCWAFSNAAAAETAILREGLTDDKYINVSERNIDFSTNSRTEASDPLNLNPHDIWDGKRDQGSQTRYPSNGLSMWTGVNTHRDYYGYVEPEYVLENSSNLNGILTDKTDMNTRVELVKEQIAKYGAVAIGYVLGPHSNSFYYNAREVPLIGSPGHSIAIVGWDDRIPKERYYPHALRDGGWICKNSWGTTARDDGYFYMSYDSPFSGVIGYDFTKAHTKYDNNYYYDAKADTDGFYENANNKEVAAIFPVRKAKYNNREFLKAVNVGFQGTNVTVEAKIYKNVPINFDDPYDTKIDPKQGTLVATGQGHAKHSGYLTIPLNQAVELKAGENFAVVLQVTNPTKDAKVMACNDLSVKDNFTYYHTDNGQWANPAKDNLGFAFRIKAFTKDVPVTNVTSQNLKDATLTLSKKSYRYHEYQDIPTIAKVRLDGKDLIKGQDFDVLYENEELESNPQTGDAKAIIGRGTIVVKGKGQYHGLQKIHYDILTGLGPNLQGLGQYEPLAAYPDKRPIFYLNLTIDKNATCYKDIELPTGFRFEKSYDQPVDPNDPIDEENVFLVYRESDSNYYRRSSWGGSENRNLIFVRKDTKPVKQELPKAPEFVDKVMDDDVIIPPVIKPEIDIPEQGAPSVPELNPVPPAPVIPEPVEPEPVVPEPPMPEEPTVPSKPSVPPVDPVPEVPSNLQVDPVPEVPSQPEIHKDPTVDDNQDNHESQQEVPNPPVNPDANQPEQPTIPEDNSSSSVEPGQPVSPSTPDSNDNHSSDTSSPDEHISEQPGTDDTNSLIPSDDSLVEETNNNQTLIIGVSVTAAIVVASGLGGLIYYLVRKQQKKTIGNKQEN